MRKPLAVSLVLSSALGGPAALAAPQGAAAGTQCVETGCFIDEVLVVKGDEKGADGKGLVFCEGTDCNLGNDKAEYLQPVAIDRAVQKAVAVAAGKGVAGPWDEVVVFTADFGTPKGDKQAGPLFYRTRTATASLVNKVKGLGLPVAEEPGKPYVGMVSAGTTKNTSGTVDSVFGRAFGASANGNFNRACDESTNSLCFKDIYTYFDALAQATAMIYAPYLPKLTALPVAKTTLVNPGSGSTPDAPKNEDIAVNIWHSFINTNGSLMGGNTWRDKGNGTWEVARPPAFQGVSAPFENSQVLRFVPLDLYMLGFIPQGEVKAVGSFREAAAATIYAPASSSSFGAAVGPGMGVKISGVALRTSPSQLVPDAAACGGAMPAANCLLTAGGREPSNEAGTAPQAIKQLWVVVTKPPATPEATKTEVQNVAKARRSFQHYFYSLAQYRGRVVTTADGEDDSGYFEFGDAVDDPKEFDVRGAWVDKGINGIEEIPNTGGRAITVARINGTGVATKATDQHKLRIVGSSEVPLKNNVATVRLRLPASGDTIKGKLAFTCTKGALMFSVPAGDGNLLSDGKFHNYSVALDGDFAAPDNFCTGVEFTTDQSRDNLEIDFIKVGNASDANLKDDDKECDQQAKADGWLALEDNCPKVYNPGQEDGNGDGVGDACEDYDGDNVVNRCDNCPTVTNSSQRDANNNKAGDACDGSQAETCFFSGATVAGTGAPSSASIWAGLATFGLMVAGAVRRRRRRK